MKPTLAQTSGAEAVSARQAAAIARKLEARSFVELIVQTLLEGVDR
jgi:hypothetical protein